MPLIISNPVILVPLLAGAGIATVSFIGALLLTKIVPVVKATLDLVERDRIRPVLLKLVSNEVLLTNDLCEELSLQRTGGAKLAEAALLEVEVLEDVTIFVPRAEQFLGDVGEGEETVPPIDKFQCKQITESGRINVELDAIPERSNYPPRRENGFLRSRFESFEKFQKLGDDEVFKPLNVNIAEDDLEVVEDVPVNVVLPLAPVYYTSEVRKVVRKYRAWKYVAWQIQKHVNTLRQIDEPNIAILEKEAWSAIAVLDVHPQHADHVVALAVASCLYYHDGRKFLTRSLDLTSITSYEPVYLKKN
jgi:hypothetical protein